MRIKLGGGGFYAPLKPVTTTAKIRFKFRGKARVYKIHYVPVRIDNYVFWFKYYPKKTADGKVVYVKGVSGCAIHIDRPVFFPSIDADARTPPKALIENALYYRKYVSQDRVKYHVILPPVDTLSRAIKLMRRYNDNHHLKVAIRTRMCPNWGVIRLTELPTETTLELKAEYPYNALLRL